jgi:hypothetical protein
MTSTDRMKQLRQFRKSNGLCIVCAKPSVTTICVGCLERSRIRKAKRYQRIVNSGQPHPNTAKAHTAKLLVMNHYGPQCKSCQTSNLAFLTLDHIDNNGAAHRKQTNGGANLYSKLITAGYPEGYQCLCWNCNYRKRRLLQLETVLITAKAVHDRNNHRQLRKAAFAIYGNVCQCCNLDDEMILTIDHVTGGGRQHKRTLNINNQFYKWLAKNSYPIGFQTLCFNCNCGRSINNGVCPHQSSSSTLTSNISDDTLLQSSFGVAGRG